MAHNAGVKKYYLCVLFITRLYRKTLLLCVTRKCCKKSTECIIDGGVVVFLRRGFVYLWLRQMRQHRMRAYEKRRVQLLSLSIL